VVEPAITDATLARALLDGALAVDAKPGLTEAQVDTLFGVAASVEADGTVVYSRTGLNRAAAMGWNWKTALVSEAYEIAAGDGRALKRQQWFDQCRELARLYGTGEMDVLTGAGGPDDPAAGAVGKIVEVHMPFFGHGGDGHEAGG
jgi:hypothetical protein